MIEVTTTGKCRGCPGLSPDVWWVEGDGLHEIHVDCQNRQLCQHLEQFIEERIRADRSAETEAALREFMEETT